MDLRFEWDPEKAKSNFEKHGVSFEEGVTIFGDPLSLTTPDEAHSHDERRYMTMGRSIFRRIVLVWHTDDGAKTRIIGARLPTGAERRTYESGEG